MSLSTIRGERALAAVIAVTGIGVATSSLAQDRPSEDEMFGSAPPASSAPAPSSSAPAPASSTTTTPPSGAQTPSAAPAASAPENAAPSPATSTSGAQSPATPPNPAATSEVSRDAQILGSGESSPMFTEEAAPDDPLKIGGQVYLRVQSTGSQGRPVKQYSFSSPSMLDVYMDARPNERVRAFGRGRMVYDPTLPASAGSQNALSAVPAGGSTSGSQSLSSLFQGQTRDPKVYLDQLWINFDMWHRAYVTAGKQHVRWGTGHFWAPTDFLHLRPRNPLDVFDARTGTSMVKLHVPIESRQWNFYAYGITENADATQTLGNIAGAARAEFVVDTTELGLGVLGRRGAKPRLAADLSTGIGDFDFYGEVGLRDRSEVDRVRYDPNAVVPPALAPDQYPTWMTPDQQRMVRRAQVVDAYYPTYREQGMRPQVVGGVTYSRKYNDNDMFTLGAEYFYNPLGYSSPTAYPGLVLPHSYSLAEPASFFYLGRHYGAVYATFPAPYKLDNHTFTLSTLGNLSDQSFITRFDYSLIVLTHVRFEAFVSARYGRESGEFRFGVKNFRVGDDTYNLAPAIMDFGLALRVAI